MAYKQETISRNLKQYKLHFDFIVDMFLTWETKKEENGDFQFFWLHHHSVCI